MVRGDWLHEPVVGHTAFVQEHGPEAGQLHWQVLQNLRAWLAVDEGARATLVLPPPPDVEDRSRYLQAVTPRLERLDRVVRGADADVSLERRRRIIAHTAAWVAEWAEEAGAFTTGLGYAQVAAALLPDEPWNLYHVGRLARKAGEPRHAVTWLRRAWRAAREQEDTNTLVLVLGALGHVHQEGGRLRRSRSYYRRAYEFARSQGRAALAGDMLAELCLTELEMGNLAVALPNLEHALALFEPGDVRILHLAHEAAWLLMDTYGVFRPPFQVFDALLEHVWEPRSRIFLQAHRARAAAGARLYREFERSWNDTIMLANRPETQRVRSTALVQLSLAAALLRNFTRARYALLQASPLPQSRHNEESVAAKLMRTLESDHPAVELWEAFNPPPPSAVHKVEARRVCRSAMERLRQRDRGDPFSASRQEPKLPQEAAPGVPGGDEHSG